jgi:hypothetical protein
MQGEVIVSPGASVRHDATQVASGFAFAALEEDRFALKDLKR